ncbi:hypothetical protein BDZ88DRAFT_419401 [Geranomyces variabilis]|nr:hypothetical protein BDZ88DRAFT_419401 [Geranomyces variabilis]
MSAHALVYGGAGALGRAVVGHFRKSQWTVTSVDFAENADATHNVVINPDIASDLEKCGQDVEARVAAALSSAKLGAVVNAAGGWVGGGLADPALYKNVTLSLSQSVNSSVISARLAALHLKEGGLLAVVGASAALDGTPGMIAYGASKAAVHQLVKSAAGTDSGLPKGAKAVAVLPVTLDTPMNRKFMPDADRSTWTPLEAVAKKIGDWANGKENFTNGGLYEVVTKAGETEWAKRG